MHRKRRRIFFDFPVIIIVGTLILSLFVMLLWNAVLTAVLHVSPLNYGQAIGLLVLCRILFVGFKGRPGGSKPRMWRGDPMWRQKWMNMNDEERAKFREEWKKRCNPPHHKQ